MTQTEMFALLDRTLKATRANLKGLWQLALFRLAVDDAPDDANARAIDALEHARCVAATVKWFRA